MLTTSEDRQEAAVVKQLASLAPREHPGSSPESGNVDRFARTGLTACGDPRRGSCSCGSWEARRCSCSSRGSRGRRSP